MESPLGWSPGGPGSVCLAFDQLRDVIESQEELIHQLKNVSLSHPRCPAHQSIIQPLSSSLEGTPPIPAPKSSLSQALLQMILQDENFVSKEEFKAMEKKLAEERAAHAKTKLLLAKEEEKLQFALGEVEVLSKQLEKEKVAFEKALSNVKSRVLQESSKKDQLITKCNGITCLTFGSRSSRRATWPRCWTRSIRKSQECGSPATPAPQGKNKIFVDFLFFGYNAQPLSSLL
ncbi:spermatogenesis-associated protein 24 isoform X2 [Cavia porcellus]|uniref:spermatogenesis-associated protein 24 isoform X2 n=1 Tax=Cavia porcellus TaxID=10141 RepID=UPI002FE3231F